MIRLYLDSNVFRQLKKTEQSDSQSLAQKIKAQSNRLLLFYSEAHMNDLNRDKSDKKFEDLEYMSQFVGTNYLSLKWGKEIVNSLIATPKEAFESIQDIDLQSDETDFNELLDNELLNGFPELKKSLQTINEYLDAELVLDLEKNLAKQPEEYRALWRDMLGDVKDVYTRKELTEFASTMQFNLFEKPEVYKNMRRVALEKLQLVNKHNINIEADDFNELLANTSLERSFLDLVNATVEDLKLGLPKYYTVYTTAYNMLNSLGLDKESNKKAKVTNTVSDANHSFFAAHCDYLVSDDAGMLLKSRALYKMFGISTKVLSFEEFERDFYSIAGVEELSFEHFLDSLKDDLRHGPILSERDSALYKRRYITIELAFNYFGYFNLMDVVIDDEIGSFIVLFNQRLNYSSFTSYKEMEGVTNNVVKLLGPDMDMKSEFQEEEIEEIKNGKWEGRTWVIEDMTFMLEINAGTDKFDFLILPAQE